MQHTQQATQPCINSNSNSHRSKSLRRCRQSLRPSRSMRVCISNPTSCTRRCRYTPRRMPRIPPSSSHISSTINTINSSSKQQPSNCRSFRRSYHSCPRPRLLSHRNNLLRPPSSRSCNNSRGTRLRSTFTTSSSSTNNSSNNSSSRNIELSRHSRRSRASSRWSTRLRHRPLLHRRSSCLLYYHRPPFLLSTEPNRTESSRVESLCVPGRKPVLCCRSCRLLCSGPTV